MNITAQEKIMYDVMKAIYDSGIPMSFKGSMVLKASLIEAGYLEETRHTVDIDANWNFDNMPTGEQMTNSLQEAINNNNIDFDVNLYRMYGEGRSAGFELIDRMTGDAVFTMDIDVNRPIPSTKLYEISDIRFRGSTPNQMIADKLTVISTDRVFRRIKDVVDMFYISKVFDFDAATVSQIFKESNRKVGDFNGFVNRYDELEHAYNKFRFTGNVLKPPFKEVYESVKSYIKELM